jgi:hypothetical protein
MSRALHYFIYFYPECFIGLLTNINLIKFLDILGIKAEWGYSSCLYQQ